MAHGALRLPRLFGWRAIAAQYVHAVRHHLKMGGVDAHSVPAEVVKVKAKRDRAASQLVGEAVGVGLAGLAVV